jgi:hypothetical protein
MKHSNISMYLFAALIAVAGGGCKRPQTPQNELAAVVADASGLLERHEYAAFLERYVSPDERAAILGNVPLQTRAEQFGREASGKLLEKFRRVRAADCRFDAKRSEFACPMGPMENDFVLVRIDGRWYLRN